jgi:peptide-methionine (S)-S-oxide reductase
MKLKELFSNERMRPGKVFRTAAIVVLISLVVVWAFARGDTKADDSVMVTEKAAMGEGDGMAVFAGGCFWGVEAVFERLEGVVDVMSGYSGGSAETASYYKVGSGTTGHAEAVQILYDSARINYETLLEVFFSVAHDPTQLNYQGPDVGTEYRSAIFYADDDQKQITERFIKELEKENAYDKPIVTQVAQLDKFYPAEDYHQDFMALNPNHPYIVYWDAPKIAHLEKEFPELLADSE